MKNTVCRFCCEEIKADALICKHCHSKLKITFVERVLTAIQVQNLPVITVPSVSACKALCIAKFPRGHLLEQCFDDCKAAKAIALVAERLNEELHVTFWDIIWGGGDIDPIDPIIFEKKVRESFSRGSYK